jgi:hypothetical protein
MATTGTTVNAAMTIAIVETGVIRKTTTTMAVGARMIVIATEETTTETGIAETMEIITDITERITNGTITTITAVIISGSVAT